jgi:hypothetical protein
MKMQHKATTKENEEWLEKELEVVNKIIKSKGDVCNYHPINHPNSQSFVYSFG